MPNYCGSLSATSPKPFLMWGSRCCPQAALRLHVKHGSAALQPQSHFLPQNGHSISSALSILNIKSL